MEAKKVYICDRCDSIHEHHFSAEACCQPDVYTEYQCSKCEEVYESEEEAEQCCQPEESDTPAHTPRCSRTPDMFGFQEAP